MMLELLLTGIFVFTNLAACLTETGSCANPLHSNAGTQASPEKKPPAAHLPGTRMAIQADHQALTVAAGAQP